MTQKISNKSITMSVRLSETDADFLTDLNVPEAKTPSDKLRSIIQQYKVMHESTSDYSQSMNLLKGLSEPSLIKLLESERVSNLSSELISKFSQWMVESYAYFITSIAHEENKLSVAELKKIEEGVAQRIFKLIEWTLRMGVTENAPCYDKKIISKNTDTILELMQIINEKRSI